MYFSRGAIWGAVICAVILISALFIMPEFVYSVSSVFIISNSSVVIGSTITNSTGAYVYYDGANLSSQVQNGELQANNTKNVTSWILNNKTLQLFNYPFDAGSTNFTTKDYSGNNYNGNMTGNMSWNQTGGYDGFGTYNFFSTSPTAGNGSGIRVNNGATIIRIGQVNLSMTVWARPNSASSIAGAEIMCGTNTLFCLYQGGAYYNAKVVNSTIGTGVVIGSRAVSSGAWTFLSVTYNGTNVTLYVNGVSVNSSLVPETNKTPSLGNIVLAFAIGKHVSLDRLSFNGSIDDAILWNRTLSPDEVFALYNNKTNTMVAKETKVGDRWSGCVATFNVTSNSTRKCSSDITVTGIDFYITSFKELLSNVSTPIFESIVSNNRTFDSNILLNWTFTSSSGTLNNSKTITLANKTIRRIFIQTNVSTPSPNTFTFNTTDVDINELKTESITE